MLRNHRLWVNITCKHLLTLSGIGPAMCPAVSCSFTAGMNCIYDGALLWLAEHAPQLLSPPPSCAASLLDSLSPAVRPAPCRLPPARGADRR